jgi:hypothetical protein
MQIDLLHFAGCPSWKGGLEKLKAALSAEGLKAAIQLVKVACDEDANCLKFLGSPSFCVDSQDWWPEERKQYSLSCRVYHTPQGMKGTPSVEMLREKFRTLENR